MSKGDGHTSNFSLRSWVYIDRMQPQYAAYAGSVKRATGIRPPSCNHEA